MLEDRGESFGCFDISFYSILNINTTTTKKNKNKANSADTIEQTLF